MSKSAQFGKKLVSKSFCSLMFACASLSTTAFAADVLLDSLASAPAHQRFIVTYKQNTSSSSSESALTASLQNVANLVSTKTGKTLSLGRLRRLAIGSELIRADRLLDRAEAEVLMRLLGADPDVASVEVDRLLVPNLNPNDPNLSDQWAFGTSNAGINVRPAWDKATGKNVVVAVLDTGITKHPDLSANILPGYDFISDTDVSNDGDGRDSDPSDPGDWYVAGQCNSNTDRSSTWHGTHVTGTIAAVTNNSIGVAGTAFNAKIVPVRVLGRCGGYFSDWSDAVVWASGGTISGVPVNKNPAQVINMSLGGSGTCSSTFQNSINAAVSRGTAVVVAAGNSNADVSTSVPANCKNVIAVAATTSNRVRASYSNFGSGIDISAPGSDIVSTFNNGSTSPGAPSYALDSGTSMATPHVVGVIALMQSVAPQPLTPAEVKSILKGTAATFSCSEGCGAGLLNADAAVKAAKSSGNSTGPY